ncbi:MAG: ribosome-associated ATPase/putative transporter RbbA [Caulobacteraceae bacterium]|nr:ribosome-associated ATPase/putative transporter RbbA [Caulobacteraceae bacterium]
MVDELPIDVSVTVAGLSHRYKGKLALDAADLIIPTGSTTALVGPDGVGKSCLLSLIAGSRRIQNGTVRVFGVDMADARARTQVAGRIAFMPQGLGKNLYPTLSVRENIDFHAQLHGQGRKERDARIARLLAATGLSLFADRPAGKLSGGMKQKLSLCCALVHDPDLLILDEPTTGIDPLSRRQFWALIDTLRASRPTMTVIVATGYMEEAERFERIVAMNDGRILAAGSAAHVIDGAPSMEEAYARMVSGAPAEPLVLPPLAPSDGPPAIRADGLTRRFAGFTAVDHVSFEIQRGEIFGFLGSNGCGKTTTMKMLVGLLAASEGSAQVLGQTVDASDLEGRLKLGYMSQAFSLYEELTVSGNLRLQAELYRIPASERGARIETALKDFELTEARDAYPNSLPLGMRQRLQLAAACIHHPDILILDEPTSGVDPAARDMFWRTIIRLAREEGVTVFLSTHFMNEAARCDRISLMHAGKVLAVGTPEALKAGKNAATLEEAFIEYLQAESETPLTAPADIGASQAFKPRMRPGARALAFAGREALELWRDPVRMTFSILAPLLLMVVFAYGISFDVEHLPYAVLDRDHSVESRALIESFQGSRYFDARAPLADDDDLMRRMRTGEVSLAISIPPGYGKDLLNGHRPEVGLSVDGSQPFRGETARGYALGLMAGYAQQRIRQQYGFVPATDPIRVEPRFLYNQDFRSVYALPPGVIMFLLAIIPAMMTALGIVRERELGSIINLYTSPASVGDYLIGKQAPYVALGFIALIALILMAWLQFEVPVKGSLIALLVGGLAYVITTTAFGVLLSTLFRSQVAVMAAAAILTMIPAINYSGLFYPTAEIEGTGRLVSAIFPGTWFQIVSLGAFTKGLSWADLWPPILVLLGISVGEIGLARLVFKKQEV